ncbi:MAG: hypothetical protein R6U96_00310 [Promethearchaeia archaeon]
MYHLPYFKSIRTDGKDSNISNHPIVTNLELDGVINPETVNPKIIGSIDL